MGQIRFLAPQSEHISPDVVRRAYLAGLEGIPWLSRNTWVDNHLILNREIDESGNLHIPWRLERHGCLVLSTASLMERQTPYHLPVELARGTLNRLRNQTAAWQAAGLTISPKVLELTEESLGHFVRAATRQNDMPVSSQEAQMSMEFALDAIEALCLEYAQTVLELRHKQTPQLPTLLAGDGGPLEGAQAEAFLAAFNAAVAPAPWQDAEFNEGEYDWTSLDRRMEWCRQHNLRVLVGPLVHLDRSHLPDWLYLWEGDFDNIQSYTVQFVTSVVRRYRGRANLWHCAAGMNVAGELSLSEEQKLRLTVNALETIRRNDPRTPILISFNQPWGEYLAVQNYDLSPLHFADALVRADLGVSGLGLEVNLGYFPDGMMYRDLLEFNRQIDQWSLLGLPLVILLSSPSDIGEDELARKVVDPLLKGPNAGGANQPSLSSQRILVENLATFLLSKSSVQAIVWTQWTDDCPHRRAHGGLICQGEPKPALEALVELRKNRLN